MKNSVFYITVLLLLGSCAFVKKGAQEYFDQAQEQAPYDVIIVPGVPFDGENWQRTMQMRVIWSNYLYKNGYAENIIYSGGAVYTQYCEAKVMALYAEGMGIPVSNIFLDTNAEHSTENVYFSYQIAKEQGFERIALATDPFQSNSLKKFIKKHELPVAMIPVVFDSLVTLDHTEPEIDASQTIARNFVSIKERESFFTRLKGTFGKQIYWFKSDLPNDKLVRKYEKRERLIEDQLTENLPVNAIAP